MTGCSRGKNAGKPIRRERYWLGVVFFTAYHVVVQSALTLAGVFSPRFRSVAAFHREYFWDIFGEVARRDGITFEAEEWRIKQAE